MSKGKGWDLTSQHSLEGAAEWIRAQSGALLVLVVRAEDTAFAVDKAVAPTAAIEMVELVLPSVQEQLQLARLAAREAALAKAAKQSIWK